MKHSLHHSLSLGRRGFLGTLGALAATGLPLRSMAQATPSAAAAATTTIVVPFPPGGISDATVRLVGSKIASVLDTKVVVDNRPGGNGLIGVQAMKGAPADGSRLFIGNTGTHSANPYFYAKLPYDPVQDFVPVSGLVATPHVLVVRTESPVKSFAQLIDLAKSKPGGLSFASQGAGSGGHLLGAMLAKRTGIAMTHVPYRGAPPALIDLLGGQVDLLFDSVPTSLPFIRDGKLRVLASASPRRNPLFPDVPSTAELGYPELEMSFWFGVFAPAGTPEATVARLNTAFVSVIETPEVRTKLTEQGLEIIAGPRDKFREFMAADNRNLGRLIKTTGATIE